MTIQGNLSALDRMHEEAFHTLLPQVATTRDLPSAVQVDPQALFLLMLLVSMP